MEIDAQQLDVDSATPAAGVPLPHGPSARVRQAVKTPWGRFNLEVRQDLPAWQRTLLVTGAICLGLAISCAILIAVGAEPSSLLDEFIVQTLFNARNFRAVLNQMAPLLLVGLAASVAFRVRFWNLGIEGQMIWGGIGATAVSIYHIGPEGARLWLMLVLAMLSGIAWIGFAALLKMRFRVNEIISTLLLNYVAADFMFHLLFGSWHDPQDAFPHSQQLAVYERFGDGWWGVNTSLPFALGAAALCWWLLSVSRAGMYMKFVSANDRMALNVGVPLRWVAILAVTLSGALAAAGGLVVTAAQEGRLTQDFFEGYGFSGVLIAFLARNNPLAVMAVSFLVALLFDSGRSFQVLYQIPFAVVLLIQAIVVMCVAASEFLIRHRVRWIRQA